MSYNTGNPVPSRDPRDLVDNAENLDRAVNGDDATWTDRLGQARKSWAGMESEFQDDQDARAIQFAAFIAASGYEFVGDYAGGIELTGYQQILRDTSGEFWRLSGSVTLPYTTTGAGLPEGGNFVAVGDAVLRQDLVQPVATFNNVADMVASGGLGVGRKVRTLGYYTPGDGGGNDYEIVAGGTGVDDGGSFIDLANGLQAKGLFPGGVDIRQFGARGDGVTDCTAAVQAAVNHSSRIRAGEGTFVFSGEGIFCPDNLHLTGSGKKITVFKKKPGMGELSPILRENVVDGVPQPAVNIRVEDISFEGNGDPNNPDGKGAGLLRFYASHGLIVNRCEFYKSKGYGVGLQGADSAPNASNRGPNADAVFRDCEFYLNGRGEYLLGNDTDDGIDLKSSDRVVFIACRAWENGDKGFDCRARSASFESCYSWGNTGAGFATQVEGVQDGTTTVEDATATFIACYAFENGGNGFVLVPQVTPGVVDGRVIAQYVACEARKNLHNFSVASQGTNDLALAYLELIGCRSFSPVSGTRHLNCSAPTRSVSVLGGLFYGGDTTGLSVDPSDTGHFSVCGAKLVDIGGRAIWGSDSPDGALSVTGVTFNGVAGVAVEAHSNCTLSGNTYTGVISPQLVFFKGGNNRNYDKAAGVRSVSSATELVLPSNSDHFVVTGTTDITSISTGGYSGRIITLRFTGALTVFDGGNLGLNGNFTASPGAVLTLVQEGASFYEMARSV